MVHTSKRGCIGYLVVLVVIIGAVTVFVYYEFHPRDRVEISVQNIPLGTRFLCLISAKEGKIKLMDWSPYYIFPGRMAPGNCTMSYRSPDDQKAIANWHVMWDFGDRYGIVTRRIDKKWRITWFNAADLPLEGRGDLLGEGSVEMDLAKGQTEQVDADEIRRLGLQEMHWADEK